MLSRLRIAVFLPPFLLLCGALLFSLYDQDYFLEMAQTLNRWLLESLGWVFNGVTILMVLTCAVLLFSKQAGLKIGGEDAQPLLNRWQWFSITLCTTIATGILFWGTAEPLFHLKTPTNSLGIEPFSEEAARFSLATILLHWCLSPYAIYTLPAMVFALGFYNYKKPFSLSTTLFPLFKQKPSPSFASALDAACLFALVAGMAASLGAGILSLSGGLQRVAGIPPSTFLLGVICMAVVGTFIVSAISGLLKGIRLLSFINFLIFSAIALLVFALGPTSEIIERGSHGLLDYLSRFVGQSTFPYRFPEDDWSNDWTVFYWANWMAWAPVTSLFLGKIARGYTLREMIVFNWLLPAGFSVLWMSIFSGSTLEIQLSGKANLSELLQSEGAESIVYGLFETLPGTGFLVTIFLVAVFLSYVTAADSNTEAMSALSTFGISPESPTPPVWLKVLWGSLIGLVALVMVSFAGIDGVKMLSNLGGAPALFLLTGVLAAVWAWWWKNR